MAALMRLLGEKAQQCIACRSVEPLLGASLSGWAVAAALLWGVIGAIAATVSGVIVPPRAGEDRP